MPPRASPAGMHPRTQKPATSSAGWPDDRQHVRSARRVVNWPSKYPMEAREWQRAVFSAQSPRVPPAHVCRYAHERRIAQGSSHRAQAAPPALRNPAAQPTRRRRSCRRRRSRRRAASPWRPHKPTQHKEQSSCPLTTLTLSKHMSHAPRAAQTAGRRAPVHAVPPPLPPPPPRSTSQRRDGRCWRPHSWGRQGGRLARPEEPVSGTCGCTTAVTRSATPHPTAPTCPEVTLCGTSRPLTQSCATCFLRVVRSASGRACRSGAQGVAALLRGLRAWR